MARRRMIDPNFWESEDISKLSYFARLVFIGIISNADDEGKGRANANYIKSRLFPYDDLKTSEIEKALAEIEKFTSTVFYSSDGNEYYSFLKWRKWQRVDKPQKSMIPDPAQSDSENGSNISSESDSENGSKNESKNNAGVTPEQLRTKRKEDNISKDNINSAYSAPARGDISLSDDFTPKLGLELFAKYAPALSAKLSENYQDHLLPEFYNAVDDEQDPLTEPKLIELFKRAEKSEWLTKKAKSKITMGWLIKNRQRVMGGEFDEVFGEEEKQDAKPKTTGRIYGTHF